MRIGGRVSTTRRYQFVDPYQQVEELAVSSCRNDSKIEVQISIRSGTPNSTYLNRLEIFGAVQSRPLEDVSCYLRYESPLLRFLNVGRLR